MVITTLDEYIAAVKQYITYFKTASRVSVASIPFSVFDLAGVPGAGTLNIGNINTGIVPLAGQNGYPAMDAISGLGYLGKVDFAWTVAGRLHLLDCLFSAGAYAFNADIVLESQPSFDSRVPNLDYKGLELWIETVIAFTGLQTVQINYLDQDGNAGDTGAIATGVAPTLGRMLRLPLEAGDQGISKLIRVRSSVSTVGTFNVHIMRPLWTGRNILANDGDVHDFLKTGLKRIYQDSALRVVAQPDSTATALMQLYAEICDG